MTYYFSENNLPALLTRIKDYIDQNMGGGDGSGAEITKVSQLLNDVGFIEEVLYNGESLPKDGAKVSIDSIFDSYTEEEIDDLWASL